jgi:hypothetical protein
LFWGSFFVLNADEILSNQNTPLHSDFFSVQIKDYTSLIDQISRVLRPGGLIETIEFDFHMYDQYHRRIELSTHTLEPPWWPRWLAFSKLAVQQYGGDVEAATHLHSWIASHPSFKDVVYRDFWIPTAPWMENDVVERRRGELMREDILVCYGFSERMVFVNICVYRLS